MRLNSIWIVACCGAQSVVQKPNRIESGDEKGMRKKHLRKTMVVYIYTPLDKHLTSVTKSVNITAL